ncbi:ABC transporter permease [Bifidobacterium mizhiense]|uniref:ABC transporter permease n=1 Tax=Bifidobacterium mizhiense TaxID=2879940 RepID=UPI001E31BD24|nr:ABC transporter permease [Bifidobacterium mizhiense]
MINQIRADFYRQRRSIGMLILLIATVALGIVATWCKTTIGISTGGEEYDHKLVEIEGQSWTIRTGLQVGVASASSLIYFYIAVFVIVIGAEYSQHTLKNTLTSGISRIQFILGKYVTILTDIILLTLCYFITILLTGLALGRKTGAGWGILCKDVAVMTLSVSFCISVIISLGIVLLIITKSLVIPAVVIVIWPILIGIVEFTAKWKWLKYFDFVGFGEQIVLNTLTADQVWIYAGVSVGVVLVAIFGSALIISKQEI